MSDEAHKLRIYLETSAVSTLYPTRRGWEKNYKPLWKAMHMWRLWARCIAGEYRVCYSQTVLDELDNAHNLKKTLVQEEISRTGGFMRLLPRTEEATLLADAYLNDPILGRGGEYDCLHLAYATVGRCELASVSRATGLIQDAVSALNNAKESVSDDKSEIQQCMTSLNKLEELHSQALQKLSQIIQSQSENEIQRQTQQESLLSQFQTYSNQSLDRLESASKNWTSLKDEVTQGQNRLEASIKAKVEGLAADIGTEAKRIVEQNLTPLTDAANKAAKKANLAKWTVVGVNSLTMAGVGFVVAFGVYLIHQWQITSLREERKEIQTMRETSHGLKTYGIEIGMFTDTGNCYITLPSGSKVVDDNRIRDGRLRNNDGREMLIFAPAKKYR